MRRTSLFILLWSLVGSAHAQTKELSSVTTIEKRVALRVKQAPVEVMAAIPKSGNWHYSYAGQANIGEGDAALWLVFFKWRTPKQKLGGDYIAPPNGYAAKLFVLGKQKATSSKWWLLNTVDLWDASPEKGAPWPASRFPAIYFLNTKTKQGHVIEDGIGTKIFWVFPEGLMKKPKLSQEFENPSFGPNYVSHDVAGTDLKGFLRIRTYHNYSEGEGIVSTQNGNFWLWNRAGWSEQKEPAK